MAQIFSLSTFQSPTLLYKATPKCPRTVIIQIVDVIGNGGNQNALFICPDPARLRNAVDVTFVNFITLSDGVNIGDPFLNSFDQDILPRVTSDIWAMAAVWQTFSTPHTRVFGGEIIVAVEAF